jgi:hypothetical protein
MSETTRERRSLETKSKRFSPLKDRPTYSNGT